MICGHPECNGRHSAADGYANLCPAARANRLATVSQWKQDKARTQKADAPLSRTLEIALPDTCVWGDGKTVGRRGMCWMHLKQMQRSGELAPFEPTPRSLCSRCRKRPAQYEGKGSRSGPSGPYCKPCASTLHKQAWRKANPDLYAEELKQGAERMRKHRAKNLAEPGINLN